MKIDYTIPGWQPARRPQDADAPAHEPSFHSRMADLQVNRPPGLKRMLRLQPSGIREILAPPPRPAALPKLDAIQERNAFRSVVLERNDAVVSGETPYADRHAVEGMMRLLLDSIEREDAIAARAFAFRES